MIDDEWDFPPPETEEFANFSFSKYEKIEIDENVIKFLKLDIEELLNSLSKWIQELKEKNKLKTKPLYIVNDHTPESTERESNTQNSRQKGSKLTYAHSLILLEVLMEQEVMPNWSTANYKPLLAMIVGQLNTKDLYQKMNGSPSYLDKLKNATKSQKAYYHKVLNEILAMFKNLYSDSEEINKVKTRLEQLKKELAN